MTDGEGTRPPRLVRRRDDRMVGGVCSGLGDHFGADPVFFRLAFVALGVFGGAGVAGYAAAWALIPPAEDVSRRPLSRNAVALAVLGAVVLFPMVVDGIGVGFPPYPGDYDVWRLEGPILAAGLVVVGLALVRTRRDGPGAPAPETTTPVAAPSARLRRPPRERSALTPITLALVLLLVGAAAAAAGAGWAPLDVGQLAALALVVVGAGLVVGAWYGRGRLLLVVGVLMIPVVLVASLVDFPPTGTIGSPYVYLHRAGELEDMRILAGQATLDLTEYPFAEGIEDVRLRVGAGSTTVIVPHDVRVEARVSVEAGDAEVFGGYESGFGITVDDAAGPEDATKVLDLEVVAGVGTVGVYRLRDPDRIQRARKERREQRRRRRENDRSESRRAAS